MLKTWDGWLATIRLGHQMERTVMQSRMSWIFTALFGFCLSAAPLLRAEEVSVAEAPIPYGFLFFEFKLIPGPYVIESIDQSVVVNGTVIAQSSVKARDNTMKQPTAPLTKPDKNGHPCDGDDESFSYWESRRKECLMTSDGDTAIARVKLAQEMNEFYGRNIATIDPQSADGIQIKDTHKGKPIEHFFSAKGNVAGFSDQDPVKSAIESQKRFAELLRRQMSKNNVVWIYNKTSGVAAVNPDVRGIFLEELVIFPRFGGPPDKQHTLLQRGIQT